MTRDGVIVDTKALIDFLKDKEPNAAAVAALIGSNLSTPMPSKTHLIYPFTYDTFQL